MSVIYCHKCNEQVDTDFNAEHFDDHTPDPEATTGYLCEYKDSYGFMCGLNATTEWQKTKWHTDNGVDDPQLTWRCHEHRGLVPSGYASINLPDEKGTKQ